VDNQKKKLFQFLSFASRKAELLQFINKFLKKWLTQSLKCAAALAADYILRGGESGP